MRESAYRIKDTLINGLRNRDYASTDTKALVQSKYMKPREFGLIPASGVTSKLVSDSEGSSWSFYEWPFPQALKDRDTFLIVNKYATGLTLSEVDSSFSLSSVNVYDADDESSEFTIPSDGGSFHIASFGDVWFLFNESCVIFKSNLKGMYGVDNIVLGQDEITVSTGCAFNGRLITAGFADNYWNVDWQAIFEEWQENMLFDISLTANMGQNFVAWSTIGGGDLFNIFFPSKAIDGHIIESDRDVNSSYVMELIKRNEMGFMPMPWNGSVYVVKKLGKGVMVYGDVGIAYIYPVMEPFPTFGMMKLQDFGIAGRGAINGNDKEHLFVDTYGNAWKITADLVMQKLDYSEFLIDTIQDECMVSYNAHEGEYYISGDEECYVLTQQGMGQCHQLISAAYFVGGELYGTAMDLDTDEAVIVTEVTDFGVRDMKTVTTIEIGGIKKSTADFYVSVDYRYNQKSTFSTSDWIKVNSAGFARIQKTATDFRIRIKCSDFDASRLDYVNVHWQVCGKRTVRGIYDNTSNA